MSEDSFELAHSEHTEGGIRVLLPCHCAKTIQISIEYGREPEACEWRPHWVLGQYESITQPEDRYGKSWVRRT